MFNAIVTKPLKLRLYADIMQIEYVPSWNWSNNCLAQSTIIVVHSYCNVIIVLHGIIFYLYTDVLNECFVMLMATTFFLCRWTSESECISLAKCRYISAARLVQVDAFDFINILCIVWEFTYTHTYIIHTHLAAETQPQPPEKEKRTAYVPPSLRKQVRQSRDPPDLHSQQAFPSLSASCQQK